MSERTPLPGDVISWVGYEWVKPQLVAGASGDRDGVSPVWTLDVGTQKIVHHKWGVSTERLHVAARSP